MNWEGERAVPSPLPSDTAGDTAGEDASGTAGGASRVDTLCLGARLVAKRQYWTVLADPAGNEYCLVGREPI